jgi:hypothetical protein
VLPLESDDVAEQFERNRKRAEYRMNFANRCVDQRDAMRFAPRRQSRAPSEGADDRQGMHVMK